MAWTEERRKQQAEICRKNKPWLKSTGPKTLQGKATVALNARKYKEWFHEEAIERRRSLFERQKERLRLLHRENFELKLKLQKYESDALGD